MEIDRFACRYRPPTALSGLAIALSLACALVGSLALTAAPAIAATATFGYTGGEQSFLVPSGNSTVKVRWSAAPAGKAALRAGRRPKSPASSM